MQQKLRLREQNMNTQSDVEWVLHVTITWRGALDSNRMSKTFKRLKKLEITASTQSRGL